jgi:phosphatidate cytidylyltransferase
MTGAAAGRARPRPQPAPAPTATERRGVLGQRVVFGLAIGIPVVGGAYLGGPWFLLGTSLLGFLALREYFALAGRRGAQLVPNLGFALAFAILLVNGGLELLWRGFGPLLGLPALNPDAIDLGVRLVVAAAVVLPLTVLLFDRRTVGAAGSPQGRLAGWALTLAGTLYVAWLLSQFQTLRLLGGPGSEIGRGWVFYVFAGTWTYDTGAYLVGSRIGRHRFMTWISPRKTWEGAAGGLVCCLLATLVAASPVPAPLAALSGWAPLPIPLWHVPFLALAVCVAAQLGDLAESMIKRDAGAKDASQLIPGHGGVLDRMDSLLFVVLLVYVYAAVVLGLGL